MYHHSLLCQLLSCNFVSFWVLDASAVRNYFLARILFDRTFYNGFFFSATMQNFCCCITDTNFFAAVCHFRVFL